MEYRHILTNLSPSTEYEVNVLLLFYHILMLNFDDSRFDFFAQIISGCQRRLIQSALGQKILDVSILLTSTVKQVLCSCKMTVLTNIKGNMWSIFFFIVNLHILLLHCCTMLLK